MQVLDGLCGLRGDRQSLWYGEQWSFLAFLSRVQPIFKGASSAKLEDQAAMGAIFCARGEEVAESVSVGNACTR
jgi:hypothetical protein